MNIIFSGVIIHFILLLSIFDIYFKSPIINDVPPCESKSKPPAKRLVLFVADGLRAESLIKDKETAFADMKNVAPFLSSICELKGSWGVSHTRVPTESRPGHVALAAGFYEDPSAVAKGWKENMVEFDSIFNESAFSWAWGSPDIVPMFSKGTSRDHVFIDVYSAEEEDFSGKQMSALSDIWVFDKVYNFFTRAVNNNDLMTKLRREKVVFFLHLLGLDTAGHTHKPGSKEHTENIRIVDDGVEQVEHIFEKFFPDEKTAYVFTADHGMTDWGSHGTGSRHETETPFIAWGAGITNKTDAIDINQADIAPLMATLIGVPIPVNSVGVLPIKYLNMSNKDTTYAIFSNSRQITTLFVEKQKRTRKETWAFLYAPFSKLNTQKAEEFYRTIEEKIDQENYKDAIEMCQELIRVSLTGLDYYQNYYQKMLLTCTTLSYIGWITLLLVNMFEKPNRNVDLLQKQSFQQFFSTYLIFGKVNVFFGTLTAIVVFLSFTQSFPIMFYFHCLLPVLLWWIVAKNYMLSNPIQKWRTKKDKVSFVIWAVFYVIGIEILVYCFFERKILTLSLIGLSMWPFLLHGKNVSLAMKIGWSCSCIALSIFPMLPVVGSLYHMNMIILGATFWVLISILPVCEENLFKNELHLNRRQRILFYVTTLILLITIVNIFVINQSFQQKLGLPGLNQKISWVLLVILPFLSTTGSLHISNRLFNINLSLSIPVLLLSVNYEPMFNLLLFVNLYFWLGIEHRLSDKNLIKLSNMQFRAQKLHFPGDENEASVRQTDFRRAYFFVLYILLAFFGTGNVASLNSFDPLWVRNFLTVFSPFTMAILILIKIVIPFLTVSCTFRAITVAVHAPIRKLFLIVLMIGDVMGLQFLYMVKNEGSWLEIGMTISHFVIVQSIVVLLILFYMLSIVLTEMSGRFNKSNKTC